MTDGQFSLFDRSEHSAGGRSSTRIDAGLIVEATFVPPDTKVYRPALSQVWDAPAWKSGRRLLWVMMNPSTADLHVTDPTVSKCRRIGTRLGFGGNYIGNACDYRATDKQRLLEIRNPSSPGNIDAILEMASNSAMIIVAHGQLPKGLQDHADRMVSALRDAGHVLHILALSIDGVPVHPLARGRSHVPEDVVPSVWTPRYRA